MKRRNKIVFTIMLAATALYGHAQDLHFSQYFNIPMLVNPANTGFSPDYDFRVGGNYRSQWANVGNPYRTMSLWADTKLFTNRFENGWVGVGGSLLKDAAGSGSLTSTSGFATIAYHQMVGYNSLLSGGFGLGFTSKRIDITKLSFDDQWNGRFFDVKFLPMNLLPIARLLTSICRWD
jgi:type IX secretion system PorP/SprF family membrane protein